MQNVTVTVGAPFFNKTAIPMGLLLLFLTGAGPLLAWRKTSFQSLKRNFALPLIVALVGGCGLVMAGLRHFYAWMTLFLSIFVCVCILGEFWKGARTRMKTAGENFAQALYNLTMRNTRRYGGYMVHVGIVLLFIGFAGLAFKTETKGLMQEGDLLRVKNYLLRCDGLDQRRHSQLRIHPRAALPSPRTATPSPPCIPRSAFTRPASSPPATCPFTPRSPRTSTSCSPGWTRTPGKAVIEVFVNPLVMWVWIGGLVFMLGTLLALVPSRVEREMAEMRRAQELAIPTRDPF